MPTRCLGNLQLVHTRLNFYCHIINYSPCYRCQRYSRWKFYQPEQYNVIKSLHVFIFEERFVSVVVRLRRHRVLRSSWFLHPTDRVSNYSDITQCFTTRATTNHIISAKLLYAYVYRLIITGTSKFLSLDRNNNIKCLDNQPNALAYNNHIRDISVRQPPETFDILFTKFADVHVWYTPHSRTRQRWNVKHCNIRNVLQTQRYIENDWNLIWFHIADGFDFWLSTTNIPNVFKLIPTLFYIDVYAIKRSW